MINLILVLANTFCTGCCFVLFLENRNFIHFLAIVINVLAVVINLYLYLIGA